MAKFSIVHVEFEVSMRHPNGDKYLDVCVWRSEDSSLATGGFWSDHLGIKTCHPGNVLRTKASRQILEKKKWPPPAPPKKEI